MTRRELAKVLGALCSLTVGLGVLLYDSTQTAAAAGTVQQLHRDGRQLAAALLLGQPHGIGLAQPADNKCADSPVKGASYGNIRLPNLRTEAEFVSARPRSRTAITAVSQCSLDRLHMLEAQCNVWAGVSSVAVYWPLLYFKEDNRAGLEAARAQLQSFHSRMEREGKCTLDIVLLSETIKADMLWAYPYNALRNQAVARAKTEVLLLVDVDFMVVRGLHERLSRAAAHEALLEDLTLHRQVIVLPAFETNPTAGITAGAETAARAVNSGKEELFRMFQSRAIIQFAEFYMAGHKQSNYRKWFQTEHPYPIRYKVGYEPYVLVSRRYMPWYDERFRGYGWDKVMHIWQLDAMGFQFLAHPEAWVVHRPHPPSAGYNRTFTGAAYTNKHKGTDHLWKMEKIAKEMMGEIKAGTYPERGVTALTACREIPSYPERPDKWW